MATRKSIDGTGSEINSPEADDKSLGKEELNGGKETAADSGVNVEDFLLPRTLTSRLAKGVLPPNTSIHRDALLAITKAATVFVSYLSSHANEETDKKTIAPQDVISALTEVEFDSFRPRLERELAVYTEAAARKRRNKNEKKNLDKPTDKGRADLGADTRPSIKRLKRDDGPLAEEAQRGDFGKEMLIEGVKGRDDESDGEEETGQHPSDTQESVDDDDENDAENSDEVEDEDDNEDEDDEDVEGGGDGDVGVDATRIEGLSESLESDGDRRTTHPDLYSDLDSESESDT